MTDLNIKDITIDNIIDFVSRQDVINTVNAMRNKCDTDNIDDYHDLLIEAFSVLPSGKFDDISRYEER